MRTRNFATVLYEDSAPIDFLEIITSWHIPALLSPYHDKDVNPNGEAKKAHWHLLIMFDSVKTTDQARALFETINGVGCEVVNSIRGYARYLCHLDNPEKYLYDPADVLRFSGADYDEICMLETDKVRLIAEMQNWCRVNDVTSYAELADYALIYHYSWYRALSLNCGQTMQYYLKSLNWEKKEGYQRKAEYTEECF